MKNRKILLLALSAVAFFACNERSEVEKSMRTEAAKQQIKADSYYAEHVDFIAQAVCKSIDNVEVMNQLMVAIEKNLLFGMNEEVRLIDILFPQESKIIDLQKDNIWFLHKHLCSAFGIEPDSKLEYFLDDPIVRFIIENDIEIYFPYSDQWDGTQMPLVMPSNNHQKVGENVPAYVLSEGSIKETQIEKITHDFFEKTPVLAILSDDIPYSELPRFVDGIFEHNGVVWDPRKPSGGISWGGDLNMDPKWYNNPKYIYRIIIDNYSFHEYDGGILWVRPEVKTQVLLANIKGKDTTITSASINVREFTMKEVRKGLEAGAFIAVQDWRPEFDNSVMTVAVWEVDGGSPVNIPIELSILGKFSIKTSIPVGSLDDFQGQIPPFERDVYFLTCRTNFGNGLTPDGFAYYRCGNAKFAIKYQRIERK